VFRHSSMYGGRQFATYDQGWIGWFCRQAIETKSNRLKEPFTISGTGKQVRDVLHSDDMISLYFQAVDRIEVAKGLSFNIGGGFTNSLSLLELFSLLEEKVGVNLSFTRLPPRECDQRVFVADISKAKQILGWEPKMSKSDGISKMLEWIENGH
jgi:CDP-paratose 2-epimerase